MTRIPWLIVGAALCGGCASNHERVECEGALVPINFGFQQSPTVEAKPGSGARPKGMPTREDRS